MSFQTRSANLIRFYYLIMKSATVSMTSQPMMGTQDMAGIAEIPEDLTAEYGGAISCGENGNSGGTTNRAHCQSHFTLKRFYPISNLTQNIQRPHTMITPCP